MRVYAFWNNKGGTGKTSLCFQTICRFAERNRDSGILVIDVCPQANLSELLLGGLTSEGSNHLLERQGRTPRCSLGGYFQSRLPLPYAVPEITASDFLTVPSQYNRNIPENITLLCGDPLLELQANAINTLCNTQIPGTNTWVSVIDWISDFLGSCNNRFEYVFMDLNPSFSIYTQIALSCVDRLFLPVMADDSSRRAIQNAFSLIYGFRLPSEIYSQHAFAERLKQAERDLPQVHLVAKNRLTQYMGPASAYAAVMSAIEEDIETLRVEHPDIFAFDSMAEGIKEVRDFQTTGVVAFARGCPFSRLRAGRLDVGGRRIQVNEEQRRACVEAIDQIVDTIE